MPDMGTGDTLGSDAYKTLLADYQSSHPGPVSGDAFNNWTDQFLQRFQVGTWEELPRDYESRAAQPPAFDVALNDFSSLLSGNSDLKNPVTNPANLGASPTSPPPDNGAMLGTTGTVPTLKTDAGTILGDALSMLGMDKGSTTDIYTVSPTSITNTSATYNVNQNPGDILTPVLQAQSGFFSQLMTGFDSLVSKFTLDSRVQPNGPNGALTGALNEQRSPFGQLLTDRSLPNSPSATAATVSGFQPPPTVMQHESNVIWASVVGSLIVAFIIWIFRRGK